jgi:hypothetical protein
MLFCQGWCDVPASGHRRYRSRFRRRGPPGFRLLLCGLELVDQAPQPLAQERQFRRCAFHLGVGSSRHLKLFLLLRASTKDVFIFRPLQNVAAGPAHERAGVPHLDAGFYHHLVIFGASWRSNQEIACARAPRWPMCTSDSLRRASISRNSTALSPRSAAASSPLSPPPTPPLPPSHLPPLRGGGCDRGGKGSRPVHSHVAERTADHGRSTQHKPPAHLHHRDPRALVVVALALATESPRIPTCAHLQHKPNQQHGSSMA